MSPVHRRPQQLVHPNESSAGPSALVMARISCYMQKSPGSHGSSKIPQEDLTLLPPVVCVPPLAGLSHHMARLPGHQLRPLFKMQGAWLDFPGVQSYPWLGV